MFQIGSEEFEEGPLFWAAEAEGLKQRGVALTVDSGT